MSQPGADDFGQLSSALERHREALDENRVLDRILAKDSSLWVEIGIPEARARRYSQWVDAFERAQPQVGQLGLEPCNSLTLVGMGGSSLAAQVYGSVFSAESGSSLEVLASTCPQSVAAGLAPGSAPAGRTIISSKSGATVETLDIARTLIDQVRPPVAQVSVITDPARSELRDWASGLGLGIIDSDPDVPGRYSALSAMGLVPAVSLGVDVEILHRRYFQFKSLLLAQDSGAMRKVCVLASVLAVLSETPGSSIALEFGGSLMPLARWIEQLVAESLGKQGKGVLPVIAPEPDSCRRQLQIDTVARAPGLASVAVLRESLRDGYDLAELFLTWELAVAAAGYLCGLDPFSQPDVEGNKKRVDAGLRAWRGPDSRPSPSSSIQPLRCAKDMSESAVTEFAVQLCETVGDGQYLAILAFVEDSPDVERALSRFAAALGSLTRGATVYGFGPQYLHSTGQFHKGGPSSGHYLALTCAAAQDMPVSGKPYRFSDLCKLQADGDCEALVDRRRPVHRLHLDAPAARRLDRISEICRAAGAQDG